MNNNKQSDGHVDDITLHDYFAAKALQGLLANPGGPIQHSPMSGWHFCNCEPLDVAQLACVLADQMMLARKRK
jgi:hypothetical protein